MGRLNSITLSILQLRSSAFTALMAVALAGCFDSPLPSKSNGEFVNGAEFVGADTAIQSNGVVTARVSALSAETLLIEPPAAAAEAVKNVTVSIPAGALSIDLEVGIEEAASMASQSTAQDLGLVENSFEAAAPAVLLEPSVATETTQPMTIGIDIPVTDGLQLTQDSFLERLVVVYRKILSGGGAQVAQGIITRDELEIIDGKVFFSTTNFGMFQAVIMAKKIEEKVEKIVEKKIVSAREQTFIPPPTWRPIEFALNNDTRQLSLQTYIGNVEIVKDCAIFIDVDQVAPWDKYEGIGNQAVYVHQIEINPAHTVFARFECTDDNERLMLSEWKQFDIPVGDDTPPAAFNFVGPSAVSLETSFTVEWSTATDAVGYDLLVATDQVCADIAHAQRGLTSTSAGVSANLADGTYYLCVEAFDEHDNRRVIDGNQRELTIHTARPSTVVAGGPTGFSNSATNNWQLSCSTPPCSYEYRVNNGAWSAHSNGTLSLSSVDGAYVMDVRAVDALGGVDPSPLQATWVVDTTAPAAPQLSETTRTYHAPFNLTISGGADSHFADYRYAIGADPADCTSAPEMPASYSVNHAATIDLHVAACDQAGNMSAVTIGSYTYSTYAANLALAVTAGDAANMDIAGGSSPGDAVSVSITNNGPDSSADLSSAAILSNTTHFQFLGNTCTGSLAMGASCQVDIEPIATANGALNGNLDINVENQPSLALSGVASGFAVSLNLTPGTNTAMDISGAVSPGAATTFTLTNSGTITSGTLAAPAFGGANPANFNVASDTCTGTTLAASASCTFDIEPVATANGAYAATVSVSDGGATSNSSNIDGTASGFDVILDMTPGSLAGMDISSAVSPGPASTFTVTNNGGITSAALTAPALAGANPGNFQLGTDNCTGNTLAPAASCSFQIEPIATANGGYTADLTVSDGSVTTNTVAISGSAAGFAPVLTLTPGSSTTLNIVSAISPGAAETFTLQNTGNAPSATLIAPGFTGANPGQFTVVSDTCTGTTLAISAICTFDVQPTAVANGAYSANMSISDGGVTSNSASLSGTAAGFDVVLDITPGTANNMDITGGSSPGAAVTFTVTNNGGITSGTLAAPVLAGVSPGNFQLSNDLCAGNTLAPAATCTFDLEPIAANNMAYSALVSIDDGTVNSNSAGINGTASGFAPVLTLSPGAQANIDITGGVSPGSAYTFTIQNTGTAPSAVLQTPDLAGANPGNFTIISDTCTSLTLAVSASCTFDVEPIAATNGAYAADLSVTDGSVTSNTASLSGTASGFAPVLTITPNTSIFLDINGGASPGAPLQFTVTNSGNLATGTLNTPTIFGTDPANFNIINDLCDTVSLGVSGTCTFDIEPVAAANGAYTADLKIGDGTYNSNTVTMSGTAAGFDVILDITPGSYSNLDITGGASPGPATTFTVTNNGAIPSATLQTPVFGGSDPGYLNLAGHSCIGATLAPAATCTFDLEPQAAADGAYSAEVTISDGNVTSNTVNVDGNASGFGGGTCITARDWRIIHTADTNSFNFGVRELRFLDNTSAVIPGGTDFFSNDTAGFEGYRAFDGDPNTHWESPLAPQAFIGRTFSGPECVKEVVINLFDSQSHGNIAVEYSTDNQTTWQQASVVNVTTDNNDETFNVMTGSGGACAPHRYWRIQHDSGSIAFQVKELEFRETPGGAALGYQGAFVSTTGTAGPPSHAMDDDTNSYWHSSTEPMPWISIDLGPGNETCVEEVEIYVGAGSEGNMRLQHSDDNSAWTDEFAFNVTAPDAYEQFLNPNSGGSGSCITAQDWRIRHTADTNSFNFAVRELRFLDSASGVLSSGTEFFSNDTAGFEGYRAFDSDPNTYWESPVAPEAFIGRTFSGPECVNEVVVNLFDSQSHGNIAIEYSTDGQTTWQQASVITVNSDNTDETFNVSTGAGGSGSCSPHRYWRIEHDSAGVSFQVRELEFRSVVGGTALSYNSASASTPGPHGPPDHAMDNDTNSYWTSDNQANPWISVDLGPGNEVCVAEVEIYVGTGSEGSMRLQYSDDDAAWYDEFTFNVGSPNSYETFANPNAGGSGSCINARDWRIRHTADTNSFNFGVRELRFIDGSSSVITGGSEFSNGDIGGFEGWRAFDSDPNTYWQSPLAPVAYIGATFGVPECVREVVINLTDSASHGDIAIEYSTDGQSTWQQATVVTVNTDNTDETFNVSTGGGGSCSPHRYWRVMHDSAGISFQVRELEFRSTVGGGALAYNSANSSTPGPHGPPDHAMDDDINSYWTSDYQANPWISVDLGPGNEICVAELEIYVGTGSEGPMRLQHSDDGGAWNDAFTFNVGAPNNYETFGNPNAGSGGSCITAQDWRIRHTADTNSFNFGVRELRFIDGTSSVIAGGSEYSSNEIAGFETYRAYDTDPNTYWQSPVAPEAFIGRSFSGPECVKEVVINLADSQSHGDIAIEYSTDGQTTWQQASVVTVNSDNADETFNVNGGGSCSPHRYWRIEHDSAAISFQVRELQFRSVVGGSALGYSAAYTSTTGPHGPPDHAMDADTNTYWTSDHQANPWIAIDLGPGNETCVAEVEIYVGTGSEGPMRLQHSNDNSTWHEEFSFNVAAPNTYETFENPNAGGATCITAQDWRIRHEDTSSSFSFTVRELRFIKDDNTVATGSEYANNFNGGGFEPFRAFDNNPASVWQSPAETNQFVGLDLGAPECIKAVELNLGDSASHGNIAIEYSTDGQATWQHVATAPIFSDGTDESIQFGSSGPPLPCRTAQYWRVHLAANSPAANWGIRELMFMNNGTEQNGALLADSMVGGFEDNLAFDNDPNTAWQSQTGTGAWIGMDYGGSPACIDTVEINLFDSQSIGDIAVEWSNDGSSWTASTVKRIQVHSSLEGIPLAGKLTCDTARRYWRLLRDDGSSTMGIDQLEFIEQGTAFMPGWSGEIDSGTSSGSPAMAFDGAPATPWLSSPASPPWIGVDFGPANERCIESVKVEVEPGSEGTYILESSDDQSNWELEYEMNVNYSDVLDSLYRP